jgi:hypothetical protein
MSLLPQQIPPATEPIGSVNEEGKVTPDKNFWLFLYNLASQVLGNGGATTLTLADLALLKPRGTDIERQITTITTLLALQPNYAGRIATLEREVADLQATVYAFNRVVQ